MSNPNQMSVKEQKWQSVREWLTHLDSPPIAARILELVIALNVLGITTAGSCEGHVNDGIHAPWITLHRENELSLLANRAFQEAQKQQVLRNLPDEEITSLFSQAHKYRHELLATHLPDRKRVMGYLSRFYDGRSVPYESRIILIPYDHVSALHIQGACLQKLMSEDERARRLFEYQHEMQAFAAFLKEQFFAS